MHRRVQPRKSPVTESSTEKEVGGSTGHIRVVVRVRPQNEAECSMNNKSVIRVLDDHVLLFDPADDASGSFYQGRRRRGRDINKKKNRDVRFAFDQVFDEGTQNDEVFEKTTKLILDGLLDGYNCAVFAYGATGAGKTFTMLGNFNTPGVMFLTMMDLYQRINNMKAEKTCDVAVSYLEVYNEQIADLLVPKGYLPVREDPQAGVVIPGLSLHKPKSAEELLQMLNFGNKNRTQHPTDANAESSRSHAVFQVFVRQHDRTANITTDVRIAKMSLIDLAGSERAHVTTNRGARFREGANINKSLLALGNCINALAEGKSKGYIPYRNSKLTRLLKDSLGGNCHTVMIAAVSPSASSYEDTYNTLCYANRAKNIKAQLKRNVLSVNYHISKYAKIVDELREEVSELKNKLKTYEDAVVIPQHVSVASVDENRLRNEVEAVFQERLHIHQELLELESKDRDLAVRLNIKEKCLQRIRTICLQSDEKAVAKVGHMIDIMKRKQERVLSRKQQLTERVISNTSKLQQLEADIIKMRTSIGISKVFESRLRMLHEEVELFDTKRHVRCLQNICRYQQNHITTTEKLMLDLLQAYRQVYFVLKGHRLATNDIASQFDVIQHLVEGEREVVWADQCIQDDQQSPLPEKMFLENILQFPVLHSECCLPTAGDADIGVTPFKTSCLDTCFPMTPVYISTPGQTPGPPTATLPLRDSGATVSQSNVRISLNSTYQHVCPVTPQHVQQTPKHIQPTPQRIQPTPQCVQQTPQHIQPTPQRIQPTPQRVQPTPQCVQQTPQHIQPTPQRIQPTPQRVQPTPQCVQQTPQHIQPTSQHIQPTPQQIQPTPQHIQPTPQHIQPTPQHIQPTPQHIQPTPQHITPTTQHIQPTTQHIQVTSHWLVPQKQQVVPDVELTPPDVQPAVFATPAQQKGSPGVSTGQLSPVVQVLENMDTSLLDGVAPLMPSPPNITQVPASCQVATPVRPIPAVASGTVTIQRHPTFSGQSKAAVEATGHGSTVVKSAFSTVSTATVTKPVPEVTEKDRADLSKVKLALPFSENNGSAVTGRCLSFADVVKSPAVNLKRHLSASPVLRSPLASRDSNIQTENAALPKRNNFQDKNRHRQMNKGSFQSSNKVQRSLHRLGLPSAMDMPKKYSNIPRKTSQLPKYGRLATLSAVGGLRERTNSESKLSDGSFKPKRQRKDENRRPLVKRSQSQCARMPNHKPAFI